MPTQDFVSPQPIDEPRHEQNMPEGIDTPVPQSWKISRPGYERRPIKNHDDVLLGNAGPNVGYALKLVARMYDELPVTTSEHRHDVEPLLAEIAMRRAAHYGRAPIKGDVDLAVELLGYNATDNNDARVLLVHDCGHNEHKRRRIVNSIPEEIFAGTAPSSAIADWRASV